MAREDGATEADDARVAQDLAHALGFESSVVERLAFDPLVTAIGFDHDRERRQAGGMRGNAFLDGQHGSRCRGMNRR